MNETILLVEDDASLRRVTEFQLAEAGYQVTTAEDAEEALAFLRRERPDLVLTDVRMPGMSGEELLKIVVQDYPGVMVIVMTAFATVERAVSAMRMGAHDYLTKPFSRDGLLIAVRRALEYRGLKRENLRLREELNRRVSGELVGQSEPVRRLREMIARVAATNAAVLLLGESGTGKELVARAIHHASLREKKPFVTVNCAAIPEQLLESELFGHVRGAFTGATRDREGKFLQADGGTLFLDEIGELPLALQPKLLRVLQEMEVEPVGGRTRKVDVRIVAATNRDLEAMVEKGDFREDLYYRLAVIPLQVPALRERREDIPLLIRHFLDRQGAKVRIRADAMELLTRYDWPGNVRELQNCIERMLVLAGSDEIVPDDLPPTVQGAEVPSGQGVLNLPPEGYSLEQLEREAVEQALARCGGNQSQAARFLRIPRHTLIYRMEKYGIGKGARGGNTSETT
ncbi:two component Fis family sigma54 specific transcriptional regulator [Geothermobacter ehrlichii]|uniref:Two component Fis family sigma54 specific transcriptional regulator n=1 Tax=Geothermobacter ehrlichii TaxID=213224 RepID=A0A5D3WKD9_9BACT|nr:sigma-54 dependent transcriptional regulator [Geothermobacter ehrlichii]TYO99487.1 two component Fis family sigma54 specific transcriptional regulator [Geothermobacter ehrlichii]